MTALSFVWVYPYSQNSRRDIYVLKNTGKLVVNTGKTQGI